MTGELIKLKKSMSPNYGRKNYRPYNHIKHNVVNQSWCWEANFRAVLRSSPHYFWMRTMFERGVCGTVWCVSGHVSVGIVAMWCVNTSPAINWSISWWNLMKGNTKFHRTDSYPKVCFRVVYEPFSEVDSAPIRSAVKFYFDIDVRIFLSTSSKNIFSIDQKKKLKQI